MRRAVIVFVGGGVGSFVLGIVFVLADEAGLLRAETRLFVAVGLLGGFTTFSTFGWGADLLAGRGAGAIALVDVVASVVGGVAAAGAGVVAGREVGGALERGAV